MDWLLHNPIADLVGPSFLLLYGGVIALIVLDALWTRGRSDPTTGLDPPAVPAKPDPLVIAYLRGGANELTRLVIFDLLRRGYLWTKEETRPNRTKATSIEQAPDRPKDAALSPLERDVFDFFQRARGVQEVFLNNRLPSRVARHSKPIEEALREDQLLMPLESRRAVQRVGLVGGLVIVALGGYKLLVALEKGRHNVALLVVLAFVGLAAL